MTSTLEKIQDIYQMKVEKYNSQGITVDGYLDKMLWEEATQQCCFMDYINVESRKKDKKDKKRWVVWQHQVR